MSQMNNLIELHKSACLADFNGEKLTLEQEAILIVKRLASGAIDRKQAQRAIDNSHNSEQLRSLVNKYRKECR